jgi:hypothetical protein
MALLLALQLTNLLSSLLCVCMCVQLEPRIPGLFWRLPFSQELYNLVVPAEDEDQVSGPMGQAVRPECRGGAETVKVRQGS